ncbi:hypothetical protein [Rubrolithibacter danxiaensis]|uniref:hypothetical protein n=1 Tax=Rubrolithibacter danxiaensis TaxID=3390805 RepID=UPI003BF7DB51
MRFIVSFLLAIVTVLPVFSQENLKGISISHYVFPEFKQGTVLKKSGETQKALLNYNTLTQEMIFDHNGTKLALAQINTIDTVYIDGRKFTPVDSIFYEVADTKTNTPLFIQHKSTVTGPGASVGYGSSTQSSSATSLSSYSGSGIGKTIYNLKLPDEYKVKSQKQFFLKKDNRFIKINNLKSVQRLFKDKAEEIKTFAVTNHTNFNDVEDLIALINYISK